MFEFDAGKFVIIGIVALIVIGPKELPRVMRQVGQAVAKLRRLSGEFQAQFMDAMREADLADLKAEAAKISEAAKLDLGSDVFAGLGTELANTVEGRSDGMATSAALSSDSELHAEPPLAETPHEDPQATFDAIEPREPLHVEAVPVEPLPIEPLPMPPDAVAAEAQALAPAADVTPLRKRG
jgi:sec-independent protein translocase protein TatB